MTHDSNRRRPPALVLLVAALVIVAGAIAAPSARGAEGDVTIFQSPGPQLTDIRRRRA